MNRTIIIGIGNEFRCDDAIGLITACKLKSSKLQNTDVIEHNGDGASLMDIWSNYDNVILIDAASKDDKTGEVHIINAIDEKIPHNAVIRSSHIFSISEAIETSRMMGRLPGKLFVYAITGKIFDSGLKISEEVLTASEKVIDLVIDRINTWQGA